MKKRILITGASGLLGKALFETAPPEWNAAGTYHENMPPEEFQSRFHALDVRDAKAIAVLLDLVKPDCVIHAASVGSVDFVQRNPDAAARVNVEGTRIVAQESAKRGIFLVFISSNAVFDGKNPPYKEEDATSAANRYGGLKIDAESCVRSEHSDYAIIRPILMYGWPFPRGRENIVTRWLARLSQNRTVEAASDIRSMPLLASNCAGAIWSAVERKRTGTYHVAGLERKTLAEFAQDVARIFGYDEGLVAPVRHGDLGALAPRPADTSFITDKMQRDLGVKPIGIAEGLELMRQARLPAGR